jgi:hypothetical protein
MGVPPPLRHPLLLRGEVEAAEPAGSRAGGREEMEAAASVGS